MSLRTSLVLMVLFIGLGYLAFFEPLRTQPKEDEKADRESHVLWLKDAKLEAIHLAGEKPAVDLECAKKDKACPFDGSGEWTIAAPEKGNADDSAVGTLASSLLNLTHNGKLDFDQGYDPKEFGLDKPRAEVTLRLAAQKEPVTLKFGKASPVAPDVYLSVSSDPHHLYLVPNYLPNQVDQETFHWRNKRLFPAAEATAVNRIEWKSKKLGRVVAVRSGDSWKLEQPRAVAASKIMFEGLGSTLSYAAAKSVFAETRDSPEAKKALKGAPELEVTFSLNGGGDHKIRLYPKAGRDKLALVDSLAPVYAVDAATFDRFGKDLPEYRQRSLLTDAERGSLDEVRFVFPRDKNEITLKLKEGLWAPADGAGGELKGKLIAQSRVNGFLDQLRDSDYKAFFPVKGAGPEAASWRSHTPDVRVELKSAGKAVADAAYVVHDRKQALTESEGDVRTVGGESFLRYMPVRITDLTEAANRPVITEKGGANGHDSGASEQHGK